jgi:signal transduction histidine kinase
MSTILIVDDEPMNRKLLATLLGYDGYRIVEAADGAEALDVVRKERPALVLTDIVMPTMDGYEFVRQLRRDADVAHTPVMFYTANYFEREARGLATACGVFHVLTKPAERETILRTVRAALASTLVANAPALNMAEDGFGGEHLRLMTDKLSAKVNELEATKQRLHALVAIGQQLSLHVHIEPLLTAFSRAAREVIAARIAAVGILADDEQTFSRIVVAGIGDAQVPPELRAPQARSATPLGIAIARRGVYRSSDALLRIGTVGGDDGSQVKTFLGAAISLGDRILGSICVGGKLGADAFTDEDEQIAVSLASQLAVAYENAHRLQKVEEENVELERRVALRTAELERSNEELEQFAYVASHDLQEPLRMVASFTQLLSRRYAGRLDSDADEFIGYVVEGAERMKALITDLLAYSRVNARGAPPMQVAADRPLQRALANLAPAIDEQQAVVTVDPLPTVLVDEAQLVQLFQNLIGNAVKFHGETPPAVHVAAECRGGECLFSVRDNGIGIEPQYANQIFVMFQRLHSRSAYPGTGIGLAICKRIVARLGGRIWMESMPGAGTTFFFTLPSALEA